jgi:nucleotide-binding universal stress UspA family protein
MTGFHRVLCPIDFSSASRRALDHAAAVARWYDAPLTVLNVVVTRGVLDDTIAPLGDAGHAQLRADLQRFTAHLPQPLTPELAVCEAPDVHEAIAARAHETHADLLVMGTHGRSGFRRLILGSVTERVLRQPPCPMLIVPALANDQVASAPVQFKHIVCAVDFSPGSTTALSFALRLAQEAGGELLVLHVIEVPPELLAPPRPPIDVDTVRAAAEAEGLRRLRALIPADAKAFCTVETAVTEGAADHAILLACQARHADLVVMGVNRHRRLDRLIFGSTAARVTRAASCPVLLVPQRANTPGGD